jgi:hypothetical protein
VITNKIPCSTCIAVGGGILHAAHKGDAKITVMRNGKKRYLKPRNVLVVPDLGASLMSWRKFDDAGAKLESKNGKCWIKKDGGLLLEADKKESKLYRVKGFTEESKIAKEMDGWHERLGHFGEKAIKGYLNLYNINEKEGSALCDACSKTK